tara:strand:- start:167 stop:349 length:183 start_codon:yes stop_codon:yes gene_type:complete
MQNRRKIMSIRGNMNIKQYKELINLYDSWWDSMPREMQKEIRKFYGETIEGYDDEEEINE